ncbi:MAG: family 10 glycosylhydrolase [Clostridia bacterium]|nr:family 10 glycosylhydrolase [Clostridia bacterium]
MRKSDTRNYLPFFITGAVIIALSITAILVLIGKGENGKSEQNGKGQDTPAAVRTHVLPESARGVYLPSVYNLTFPSKPDLSAEELKGEVDAIIDKAASVGLNTLIFQVRPECDALYRSEIFPVSRYLSTDGALQFDCLGYLVEAAHAKNISVTAWVNPLRVSVGKATTDDLPDTSPAKGDYSECVVSYGGKLFLDPAIPEARKLVCEGVAEIVLNYEVDSILFDDYYYPYTVYETDANGNSVAAVFDDAESYKKYAEENVSLGDFRRDNINKLMKEVYDTVKGIDRDVAFGSAVFGIWKNSAGENGGSLTSGLESYYELYCDTLSWIEGGYVDYVAPQIYWETSSMVASFKVLSTWWNEKVENSGVKLYFSHAAYRYADDDFTPGEMTKQLVFSSELENCDGNYFYSYAAFRDDLAGICKEIEDYYKEE